MRSINACVLDEISACLGESKALGNFYAQNQSQKDSLET